MAFGAPKIGVALLGGGLGERLQSPVPKALFPILGHPMIHYSLRLFSSMAEVSAIYVAFPELHASALEKALSSYPRGALREIVAGGATRAASALSALRAMERAAPEIVLVHDAARPCITAQEVRDLLGALPGNDGAFLAVPAVDTLWVVEDSSVSGSVDRRQMVQAMTPQAFPYGILREALEKGIAEGFEGSDDVSYVTRAGGKVAWVKGDRWNIKVTYPEDVQVAEALLGGKGCA